MLKTHDVTKKGELAIIGKTAHTNHDKFNTSNRLRGVATPSKEAKQPEILSESLAPGS